MKCEVCHNEYDRAFTITTADGVEHVFDSFECAIHAVAPKCAHCRCTVVGHGVQRNGTIFCCDHCARTSDTQEVEVPGAAATRSRHGRAMR